MRSTHPPWPSRRSCAPSHGVDVQEDNLLHETGQLLVYHSPAKGCYLGQEVVARLEGRGGNVNKRFVGLRCAGPVTAGAEIVADEKAVGRVTTAGVSPRFGAIAMGFIHRSHAEPGTTVKAGSTEASVAALPFSS
jgi:folate-binding protein YgfZ